MEVNEEGVLISNVSVEEVLSPERAIRRPNTLPPKSKKESSRHEKEAKRVRKAYATAEAKRKAAAAKREQALASSSAEWEGLLARDAIAPSGKESLLSPRQAKKAAKIMAKLVRVGVPSHLREDVWSKALGNTREICQDQYASLIQAVRERVAAAAEEEGGEEDDEVAASFRCIGMDIPRTYPQLAVFAQGGPMYHQLQELLGAYVLLCPDVGYIQGMSFVAAMLLLNMNPSPALIGFTSLMDMPILVDCFAVRSQRIEAWMTQFEAVLSVVLPDLAAHFEASGVQASFYLYGWVLSLFSNKLPLDMMAHAWDLIFLQGQAALFQIALGILKYESAPLQSSDTEGILIRVLANIPASPETEVALFDAILSIKLTPKLLSKHAPDLHTYAPAALSSSSSSSK